MDNGKSKEYKISLFITAIVSSFLLFWFRVYLTDAPIPSVDLPSFNAICRGLRHHILRGEVVYYDPKFYTGMLELHFYSFFPALLTTLLSFLCDFFAGDSVRLASHLVLWFGISFFPVALCLALRPFLTELVEKGEYGSSDKIILEALYGVSLSLFSFWFLNHDRQWYGIGAAAPMHIGLISQMFGWYAVLIYLNSLWMCILGKGSFRMIAVSLAFGIFSHNLTVIFMLFLGVLAFLWYPDRRKPVFYGHLFGIGFSMFWLLPCIALSSTYVAFDIYRPKGDFLELFYRYTVYGLWQSVESWFSGRFLPLSPVEPYLMLLTIALFCFNSVRQSRLLIPFFSFGLLGIVIFNSGYVASSIPLGIHYYRYNGVLFLYFAILFSVVPIFLTLKRKGISKPLAYGLSLFSLFSFLVTASLPHYERKIILGNANNTYLKTENKILEYFKGLKEEGRVYFEYLTDYDKFPPLSAHYMSSNLPYLTSFESVVNSHVQESTAYRMIAASLKKLGAKTYNVPLLFYSQMKFSDAELVAQLRSFGITHIVSGRKEFYGRLKPFAIGEIKSFGRYRIIRIANGWNERFKPIRKPIIGYMDNLGTLPFAFVQYFFYSRAELWGNYELVDITDHKELVEAVDLVLVNGDSGVRKDGREISFAYSSRYHLYHYKPRYSHNMELDKVKEARKFLEFKAKLITKLAKKGLSSRTIYKGRESVRVSDNHSELFKLSGMLPHTFYRLNYSYFPYMASEDGVVLRGLGERIFFLPKNPSGVVYFSRWNLGVTWIGLALSVLSLVFAFYTKVKKV